MRRFLSSTAAWWDRRPAGPVRRNRRDAGPTAVWLLIACLLVLLFAVPVSAASSDAASPVLLASFWSWFDFTGNRQRVIQVGTIVMCFALFIMMRK